MSMQSEPSRGAGVRKVDQVKSIFDKPEWYLKKSYNIRIRKETVQEVLRGIECKLILDIGCGDGSISFPLLCASNRLTLVDLSESMLSVARSRIPQQLVGNVEIVNADVLSAHLRAQGYDLILCLGVLAHVDSPAATIDELMRLLKPGGFIIVENTDCRHPISHMMRTYDSIRCLIRPEKYSRNRIATAEVVDRFVGHGCRLLATYRYSLLLPGMHKILSYSALYRVIRFIYGAYPYCRLSWLGNECIHLFRCSAAREAG